MVAGRARRVSGFFGAQIENALDFLELADAGFAGLFELELDLGELVECFRDFFFLEGGVLGELLDDQRELLLDARAGALEAVGDLGLEVLHLGGAEV